MPVTIFVTLPIPEKPDLGKSEISEIIFHSILNHSRKPMEIEHMCPVSARNFGAAVVSADTLESGILRG